MHARLRVFAGICVTAGAILLSATPGVAAQRSSGLRAAELDQPRAKAQVERCSGRLLGSVPVRLGGERVGTLELFYRRGFNCAQVRVAKRFVPGEPRPAVAPFTLYVAVQRCEASTPGPLCRDEETRDDTGRYFAYAGPVRVFAPGKCIRAEGRIVLGDRLEAYAETRPGASFCG